MFSEMSYHAWRFMAFKPNDQSDGHIHGIVCWNDLIFCTRVHLGIPNKLPKGVFIFLARKIHFPFFECPKWGFFVKDLPYICCKIGPYQFSKILGHISCIIDQMVGCKKFWSTSGEKDKFPPIKLEADQIWTAVAS